MAVLENRVLTILNDNGTFTKGVSHKDHLAYCDNNHSLIRFRFNSGLARFVRKLPLRFCREVLYDASQIESLPGGLAIALRHPSVSQFRCVGFRHTCFKGLVDYTKRLEDTNGTLRLKHDKLRTMYEELYTELQKVQAENPILKRHIAERMD